MKGASILKIGANSVTIPNHFTEEESARQYLFETFYRALKGAESDGIPFNGVSIKLDPNFEWK